MSCDMSSIGSIEWKTFCLLQFGLNMSYGGMAISLQFFRSLLFPCKSTIIFIYWIISVLVVFRHIKGTLYTSFPIVFFSKKMIYYLYRISFEMRN